MIHQFSKTDSISEAFRYPTDKDDNPSLPAGLTHINLRNLAEVVDRIATILDGASIGIYEGLKDKFEMMEAGL